MYYPRVEEDNNTRTLINRWLGYNHNHLIGSGEFYDMENMTSDYFPLLAPRKIRPLLAEGNLIKGLLYTDGKVCYLEDTTFHFGEIEIDLSAYIPSGIDVEVSIIRFGSYILIFNVGVYINVYNLNDIGTIDVLYNPTTAKSVTYSMCDSSGADYDNITASEFAPQNPTDGMYWLNTGSNGGLNIWHNAADMWQPVATTYIRIQVPDSNLNELFSVGDVVFMNTSIDDINNGSEIQCIGNDYIVVTGILDGVVTKTETSYIRINRRMPWMMHVFACKNRLWGCAYGFNRDGEMVNEIYCSKLGDFKNWYSYQGLSTDSYAASVGVPGEWTGGISYQGYPVFFKENAIFKVYGSYPAEFQIVENDCRGVQKGSFKSLAVVGETLFYKSASDVVAYDGSSPVSISEALSRDQLYYNAVAGGCLNKYQIVMEDKGGKKYYFVYDTQKGIWEKEDAIPIMQFSGTENGQLYAITFDKVYGLGSTDNVVFNNQLIGEEWVSWFAQSGEMGYETPDSKYVSRLSIRANVPYRSELVVQIAYDDKPFEDVGTIRGSDTVASQTLDIVPMRCDYFRFRFMGHGDCKIYTMAIRLENGSDVYGY